MKLFLPFLLFMFFPIRLWRQRICMLRPTATTTPLEHRRPPSKRWPGRKLRCGHCNPSAHPSRYGFALALGFKNFHLDQFGKPGYPIPPGFQVTKAQATVRRSVPQLRARQQAIGGDEKVDLGPLDLP
jgi:hypothetical protein